MPESVRWTVYFTRGTQKQKAALPPAVADALYLLYREMEIKGPFRVEWRNYGPLKGKKNIYHCHLNGGKPRFVAVWKVADRTIRIVEIIYVGTHEGARYNRMD